MEPQNLVRKSMKVYKEHYEDQAENMNREAWIEALVDHPELIQRPILIWDETARIGRPPEPVIEEYRKSTNQ